MMKRTEMDYHQFRVTKFMALAKQELPEKPTIPCEQIRRLRASLILEEALETIAALGFTAKVYPQENSARPHEVILHSNEMGCNIVEVLDGCCDISVVNTGTLCAFGIANLIPLAIVDHNNLAKFGPGHSFRDDGKLIKPPGHKPPDLLAELVRQGWNGGGK